MDLPEAPREDSKAERLNEALCARRFAVRVEEVQGVAILHSTAQSVAELVASRREIVSVARLHGFSHVAVEL
jgi:hypothetical protein